MRGLDSFIILFLLITNKLSLKIITLAVWRFLFMRKKPDLKTAYLLRLLLFFGWITAYTPLFSQNAKKIFHCYLNDIKAYENYEIFKVTNSLGIDTIFTVYQIKVTDKMTGKLKEEYFRHNDSCFQFSEYDSLDKIINRGLLEYYLTGVIDTIKLQIPLLDIDPTGEKGLIRDTIIFDTVGKYRPTGKWKEKDSTGYFWKGSYVNGSKEGEWKRGYWATNHHDPLIGKMNDYFRPFDTHYFENNIELPKIEYVELWPIIEGKWYISNKDSSILLLSKNELRANAEKYIWDFKSKSSAIIPLSLKTFDSTLGEKLNFNWKQKKDKLLLWSKDFEMTFTIIDVTPTYIMLRLSDAGRVSVLLEE